MIISEKCIRIKQTQITDFIRVSTAAICYEDEFLTYYQYETWIFSDEPKQRTRQIIHACSRYDPDWKIEMKAEKVHDYISNNLKQIYTS